MSKPPLNAMTRPVLAALLALSLMPSLTSCAANAKISRPDSSRTAQVAYPDIPEGEAQCAQDAASRCLSDRQNGSLLRAYDAALTAANERLQWLADYFSGKGD